jgi:ribonuclease HI
VADDGTWDYEELQQILPEYLIMKLVACMPPQADNGPDVPLWPGERMGNFSVATAYQYLTGMQLREHEKKWHAIWRLETIERIRVFMWQVLHDRIQTKWRTAKWNLTDPYCNYCGQMEETTMHVLRDCPLAVEVWQHLLDEDHRGRFFIGQLTQWVDLNLSTDMGGTKDLAWDAVWATTCYWLWRWRNQRVHDSNYTSQWKPWSFILKFANDYKTTKYARETEQPCHKVMKDIQWKCPEKGWISLNTDGAAKSDTTMAGCGGILRNDNGIWITGFSKFLGSTTAYMAEVWGLYEGLSLARSLGIERLEVQVDSEALVKATNKDGMGCTMSWNIMQKIRDLLKLNWEVRIRHIFREGNRCADALANMGCKQDVGWKTYQEAPSELFQVLADDFRGVSFPRLVSS